MTATEELRRMLDERGVEHYDGTERTLWGYEQTGENTGIYRFAVSEISGGFLQFDMFRITPEQAVEATLGRGTCSIRGGECDQCGAHIHRDAVLFWVPAGGGMRTVESRDVSYCPNCGRKEQE